MLKDARLTSMPFFPETMTGKEITHAKTMELIGISAHVKAPDIAILQIRHTIIAITSVAEKRMEKNVFFVI